MKTLFSLLTVIVLGAALGCQTLGGRTPGQVIDDTSLKAAVNTRFLADAQLGLAKTHNIDVNVYKGRVVLTGYVAALEVEQRAVLIANDTQGVVSVASALRVEPHGRTALEIAQDAGITNLVNAHLAGEKMLREVMTIDVDTYRGHVVLTGAVPSEAHRQRAIEIARQTKGVKDVQPILYIAP